MRQQYFYWVSDLKFNTEYNEDYDEIAYKTLSEKALRSKAHVCSALNCTANTLETWINDQKSFRDSVTLGLIEGEKLFRDKLARVSLRPNKKVNTQLLLSLALDVYGIGDKERKQEITIRTDRLDEMSEQEAVDLYRDIMKGD